MVPQIPPKNLWVLVEDFQWFPRFHLRICGYLGVFVGICGFLWVLVEDFQWFPKFHLRFWGFLLGVFNGSPDST